MKRSAAPLAVLLAVCACSGGEESKRPPWADGRDVVTDAPAPRPQDLSDLPGRILELHNRERQQVRVPPLVWDADLASAAAAYGPALAARGRLRHSLPESRPGQGENLWMGTAGAFSVEEMVRSWAAEKSIFISGGRVPFVSRSNHFADVAHYTQMIWRRTMNVGCALHRARASDYLICRYSPPGNVVGQTVP